MKRILPVIVLLMMFTPTLTFAHSGGTDSAGGHHDYNNVSGLGSYHYHHGYGPHLHEGGVCPYDGDSSSSSSASYYSNDYSDDSYDYGSYDEETYTMTEDELYEYVYNEIRESPEDYDVVPVDKYNDLVREREHTEKDTDSTFTVADTLMFVGLGVFAASVAGYIFGIRDRKEIDETEKEDTYWSGRNDGYTEGFKDGCAYEERQHLINTDSNE